MQSALLIALLCIGTCVSGALGSSADSHDAQVPSGVIPAATMNAAPAAGPGSGYSFMSSSNPPGSGYAPSMGYNSAIMHSSSSGSMQGPMPIRRSYRGGRRAGVRPAIPLVRGGSSHGSLRDVKIVPSLSSVNRRSFKPSVATPNGSPWAFSVDGSGHVRGRRGNLLSDKVTFDANEPHIVKLRGSLRQLLQKMEGERRWIEDINKIMVHYRAKIGDVKLGLRSQAQQVVIIKRAIQQQHKDNAKRALEAKLVHVNQKLQVLQQTTASVTGQTASLAALKRSLQNSISSIRSQIQRIRSSSAV